MGASRVQSATCSIRSSSGGSAQWMSSNTSASGRARACVSSHLRTVQATSSGDPAVNCRAPLVIGVRLPEDLRERPVRDALAVRKAAPDEHVGVVLERRRHFAREPRLADPGWPERRDEAARSGRQRLVESRPNTRELVAPADERRVEAALEGRRALYDAKQTMCGNGVRLPLQLERLDSLDFDRIPRQAQRRLAEQDLAGLGGLLEAGGDVDGITSDERVAAAGDDFAGVDADPRLEAESSDGVAKLCRSTKRTERIVLVERRDPEDRHHCVADELLDRAAVPLQCGTGILEVPRLDCPQRLRVEPVARARVAGEIAEEDGYDLAYIWHRRSVVRR